MNHFSLKEKQKSFVITDISVPFKRNIRSMVDDKLSYHIVVVWVIFLDF